MDLGAPDYKILRDELQRTYLALAAGDRREYIRGTLLLEAYERLLELMSADGRRRLRAQIEYAKTGVKIGC